MAEGTKYRFDVRPSGNGLYCGTLGGEPSVRLWGRMTPKGAEAIVRDLNRVLSEGRLRVQAKGPGEATLTRGLYELRADDVPLWGCDVRGPVDFPLGRLAPKVPRPPYSVPFSVRHVDHLGESRRYIEVERYLLNRSNLRLQDGPWQFARILVTTSDEEALREVCACRSTFRVGVRVLCCASAIPWYMVQVAGLPSGTHPTGRGGEDFEKVLEMARYLQSALKAHPNPLATRYERDLEV